jgi:hypothetical protein
VVKRKGGRPKKGHKSREGEPAEGRTLLLGQILGELLEPEGPARMRQVLEGLGALGLTPEEARRLEKAAL